MEEKKEDDEKIAAKAEQERIAVIKDEGNIATEAEKIWQRKKEDESRSAEEAARIWRHKEEEEERIGRHEEDMCHLRMEADNIRRRRMLQEDWEDAEERRREEEDEGACSISVTDRELWRKCFREQEALAKKEAEEIRQHKEYRLQRVHERLRWEKDDVARKAAKEEEDRISRRDKEVEEECSIPVICGVCAINVDELPFMKGWMGGQEITVLRDTGSTGVMIRAELVDSSQYTGRNQRMI